MSDRHNTKCSVPPSGWKCTRGAGHEGPCAAIPSLAYAAETLPGFPEATAAESCKVCKGSGRFEWFGHAESVDGYESYVAEDREPRDRSRDCKYCGGLGQFDPKRIAQAEARAEKAEAEWHRLHDFISYLRETTLNQSLQVLCDQAILQEEQS